MILFQAHNCADQNLARKMFLPLAERMTKKYVEDKKIEAEAGKYIYFTILCNIIERIMLKPLIHLPADF